MNRRALALLALALGSATALSGCVYLPASSEAPQNRAVTAPESTGTSSEGNNPSPQSQASREPLSDEDQFMRDAREMTPQPHLLPAVRSELLEAGYGVCDAWYEGHSRALIIEVTHYSLDVERNRDLFYSDAATTLTDAALTNLC